MENSGNFASGGGSCGGFSHHYHDSGEAHLSRKRASGYCTGDVCRPITEGFEAPKICSRYVDTDMNLVSVALAQDQVKKVGEIQASTEPNITTF